MDGAETLTMLGVYPVGVLTHHPPPPPPPPQNYDPTRTHVCPHLGCGKRFSNNYNLEKHMLSHSEERPFKCPVEECGKAFKRREHLAKHKMTHTGDKPYVCPYAGCGRDFVEPGNLNRHKRTHTGDRPYVCPFAGCGKAFGQLATLHDHKKIHTGEYRFACDFEGCRKTFHKRGNYNRHLATHYGDKRPRTISHDMNKGLSRPVNARTTARKRSLHSVLQEEADSYGWTIDQIDGWVAKLEEWGLHTLGSMALDDNEIQWPMELAFVRQCLQKQYKKTCLLPPEMELNHQKFMCGYPQCGKTFISPETLNEHEASHHLAHVAAIDRHICHHTGCGKSFAMPGSLRRHLQRVHNEKVQRELLPDDDDDLHLPSSIRTLQLMHPNLPLPPQIPLPGAHAMVPELPQHGIAHAMVPELHYDASVHDQKVLGLINVVDYSQVDGTQAHFRPHVDVNGPDCYGDATFRPDAHQ